VFWLATGTSDGYSGVDSATRAPSARDPVGRSARVPNHWQARQIVINATTDHWEVFTFCRVARAITLGAQSCDGGSLRVLVNAEKCKGYAVCIFEAPEVFDLGDDNVATVLKPAPADYLRHSVLRTRAVGSAALAPFAMTTGSLTIRRQRFGRMNSEE
jgi:ferredoxin